MWGVLYRNMVSPWAVVLAFLLWLVIMTLVWSLLYIQRRPPHAENSREQREDTPTESNDRRDERLIGRRRSSSPED